MVDKTNYIRKELEMPDELIAVNAGSWGPLSRAAREAIFEGYTQEAASRGDKISFMKKGSGLSRYSQVVKNAKTELSKYLNCGSDEIALCESSTSAMNIFLWGYNWSVGDEIISGSLENPAATIPLMVLSQRRRVNLKVADLGFGEVDEVEAITDQISSKTKMILISDVNYVTGSRINLKEISKIAQENDVLLLVDGIQAVGTYPVDMQVLNVDGYAFARHKFLCGPDGAGVLYVKKEVQNLIHPTFSGVFTDEKHGSEGKLVPYCSAQKYEVSTRPLPVIMGGTAAVKWLREEVGFDYIFNKTRILYNQLWDELNEITDINIISKRNQNSLLTLSVPEIPSKKMVEYLKNQNIFSRTIGITNPPSLRLSIGVWTRESDISKIVKTIKLIVNKG